MPRHSPDLVGTNVILEHALGLADVARRAPLDARVPPCPDWTLADLVWHLTEVHVFWTHVIEHRPSGPDDYEEPSRAGDADLVDGLERAAHSLVAALDGLVPTEPAWSWSDDETVGFTLRRQSHEAAIHHVDGLLAAGLDLPSFDAAFAADGIDEMVAVMLTGVPGWATFERRPDVIQLRTSDTDDVWTLGFGRMTGTSPDSGKTYDLPALEPVDETPGTVVEGRAADVHLWLWGRHDLAGIDVRGDVALADELSSIAID